MAIEAGPTTSEYSIAIAHGWRSSIAFFPTCIRIIDAHGQDVVGLRINSLTLKHYKSPVVRYGGFVCLLSKTFGTKPSHKRSHAGPPRLQPTSKPDTRLIGTTRRHQHASSTY